MAHLVGAPSTAPKNVKNLARLVGAPSMSQVSACGYKLMTPSEIYDIGVRSTSRCVVCAFSKSARSQILADSHTHIQTLT